MDWWHIAGFPTAEEWQAFWDFAGVVVSIFGTLLTVASLAFAAIAVIYTRKQLALLAESNRALTQSNLDLSRPRVVVEIELQRMEMEDHRASFFSGLNIVVSNGGVGPAANVRLTFAPLPESYPMPPVLQGLLSGEVPITSLLPGQSFRYVLDQFPQGKAFKPEEMTHHKYSVSTRYSDNAGTHSFEESFELNIEHMLFAIFGSDPVRRLSKDVQALGTIVKSKKGK
jgi:hypothetical protein